MGDESLPNQVAAFSELAFAPRPWEVQPLRHPASGNEAGQRKVFSGAIIRANLAPRGYSEE